MTKVNRILELLQYNTTVKLEPSIYDHSGKGIYFNTAEIILDSHKDDLKNLEVEVIEHKQQYILIYYTEIKQWNQK